MRLRPSGNQGPVATRLSSFVAYQKSSAWTWEHLALTRASVITGPVALRRQINDAIREVLARPRDRSAVAAEVKSMRARIDAEKGSDDPFDLKHVRGGLIDLEFIAQFLADRERGGASAGARPEHRACALTKLSAAAVLSSGDAEILVPAARL